jgi:hypothetical protein
MYEEIHSNHHGALMIQEIGIQTSNIAEWVPTSPWWHSKSNGSNTANANRYVKNIPRQLVIEYEKLDGKAFEAKIVAGPPELLDVKTHVDWHVLHTILSTGSNIISTQPFRIQGTFIWKEKGIVKLCFA